MLIDEARCEGAALVASCECAEIDPATYRRWQKDGEVQADRRATAPRPTPQHKLSAAEREMILLTCHLPEFASLPPSQIVPALADLGKYYGSESSFYRVLHSEDEQQHRGRAKARQQRAKPDEFCATGPNQGWCWDVSWLKSPVRGKFYYLYMIMDVFSRKITAWEVHDVETGEYAAELLQRGVFSEGCSATLKFLHADNGAIQKSSTLRAKLEWLGIEASYSRPRVSNDNALSESLFRTVKYRPGFPYDGFNSIEQARQWCHEFTQWYNHEHKHSAIKFVTPNQRHSGEDIKILADRKELYERARESNPSRWSGKIRDWQRDEVTVFNADKKSAQKTAESVDILRGAA